MSRRQSVRCGLRAHRRRRHRRQSVPASLGMPYRADIDGLRAVAVASVVAFHAFPRAAPGGFVGVDVFFVMPGYLISGIVLENLERGTFSFHEFYYRRIRRIFPALIAVLAGCLVIGWSVHLSVYRQASLDHLGRRARAALAVRRGRRRSRAQPAAPFCDVHALQRTPGEEVALALDNAQA